MCNQAETIPGLPVYYLSKPDITEPHLILKNLFAEYHLPELQEVFWEFLKTAVTGNYSHDLNTQERFAIFSFYEWAVNVLEAAYFLNEARKTSKINP